MAAGRRSKKFGTAKRLFLIRRRDLGFESGSDRDRLWLRLRGSDARKAVAEIDVGGGDERRGREDGWVSG